MKQEKNIFKTLKNATPTVVERRALSEKLFAYRAMKPLPSKKNGFVDSMAPSGLASLFRFNSAPLLASFALVLFVGVGTAAAAEGAAPGDALYSVKTGVTENMRAAFAFDAESKAETDAWRAERRLEESAVLAARDELTDERTAFLETRFAVYANQAQSRIAQIEETDPALAADLSTRFEASLAAHETILSNTENESAAALASEVHVTVAALGNTRARATVSIVGAPAEDRGTATLSIVATKSARVATEADAPRSPSANPVPAGAAKRLYRSSEDALQEVEALYANMKLTLSVDATQRVDRYLEETRALFEDGEAAYGNSAFGDAFISFQSVLSQSQSLSVFLRSGVRNLPFRVLETNEQELLPPETIIYPTPSSYDGVPETQVSVSAEAEVDGGSTSVHIRSEVNSDPSLLKTRNPVQ